jgi:hypothetical protein
MNKPRKQIKDQLRDQLWNQLRGFGRKNDT